MRLSSLNGLPELMVRIFLGYLIRNIVGVAWLRRLRKSILFLGLPI